MLRAALGEEPEKSPGANPGLDSSSRRGSVRVDDLGAGDQVVAAATVAAEDQQYLDDLDQCADERDDPDGLDRQVAHTEQAAPRRLAAVQVDDLAQIGRTPWRDRVLQYGSIPGGRGAVTTKRTAHPS